MESAEHPPAESHRRARFRSTVERNRLCQDYRPVHTATFPENGSGQCHFNLSLCYAQPGRGPDAKQQHMAGLQEREERNGWEIDAKNVGSTSASLTSSAVCLVGAPTKASVKTVTGSKVTIGKGAYNSTTATCSSGVLVGGGS